MANSVDSNFVYREIQVFFTTRLAFFLAKNTGCIVYFYSAS